MRRPAQPALPVATRRPKRGVDAWTRFVASAAVLKIVGCVALTATQETGLGVTPFPEIVPVAHVAVFGGAGFFLAAGGRDRRAIHLGIYFLLVAISFAEQPAHFLDYCRGIDPAFNAGSFVPRRIFGDYLEHTLREAEKDSDLPLVRLKAEAVALRRDAATKRLRVELADGRSLDADRVVLALGYLGAQQPHFGDEFFSSAAWIVNPWNFAAMDRIEDGRPVLIVGTGHTAVDALFRLTGRDDSRKVYMVSRRGLLPKGHRANPQPPVTGGSTGTTTKSVAPALSPLGVRGTAVAAELLIDRPLDDVAKEVAEAWSRVHTP